MKAIDEALKSNSVVYVTREFERAMGLPLDTPGYYIVSNSSTFAKEEANGHDNVLLIENDEILDTWQLLETDEVRKFINEKEVDILVFKNSRKIEGISTENNWKLLNPSAELVQNIEGKVTQESFLPELSDLYPPHKVSELGTMEFESGKILQFNTSHTGTGTIILASETKFKELQTKFPRREARLTNFIKGEVFTNNNVVAKDKVLVGNISYQITGLAPYTENKFSTVGNDWSKANEMLNDKQKEEFKNIATKVGEVLRNKGWKGMFGIDVMAEKETGKLFLIEVNARQPQSAVYESKLQKVSTIFEAHLSSLLDIEINEDLTEIKKGSQIIDRREPIVKYIQD